MGLADLLGNGLGTVADLNPLAPDVTPISDKLPDNIAALQKKYQNYDFSNVSPQITQALAAFDAHRVSQGQQPLNAQQTSNVISTAQNNVPVTKAPKANPFNPLNVPGNFLHDMTNIFTSIPRLPVALGKEVLDIAHLPTALARASSGQDEQGNQIGTLAALMHLPGVRLIPGTYTLGNIAQGPRGLTEAARHPLMTLLDLLPGASKLAEGTKVAELAKEAALADETGMTKVRPLKAVALNTVDANGELARNALGRGVDELAATRPGQMMAAAFGKDARYLSRLKNLGDRKLQDWMYGSGDIAHLEPAAQQEVVAARQATGLMAKYSDLSPEEMSTATSAMQTGVYTDLSPRQLELVADSRDGAQVMGEIGLQNDLKQIDGEYYPAQQANRILSSQYSAQHARALTDLRNEITSPTLDAHDYITQAADVANGPMRVAEAGKPTAANRAAAVESGALTFNQAKLRMRGLLHAADAAGVNVDDLTSELRAATSPEDLKSLGEKLSTYDRQTNPLAPRPNVPADEMLSSLKQAARKQPVVAKLYDAIQREDWGAAKKLADVVNKRSTFRIEDVADFLDTLKRNRERGRFIDSQLGDYTERAAGHLERQAEKIKASTMPARFQGAVDAEVKKRLVSIYAPEGDEAVTQAILQNRYAAVPGFDESVLRDTQREVMKTWQDMKAAGVDPVYVHHVTPAQANGIRFPKITEVPSTPTSIKARGMDISPHVQDVTVALSHQGMEFLRRRASEEFIGTVLDTWGKNADELMDRYHEQAQALADREPRIPYQTHLDSLIKREFTPFNPRENGYSWASEKLDNISAETRYIPKSIADNLERWHNPKTFKLTALWDPVMKAFRTSVLPLSPRWHVNNILGGAMMLGVGASPMAFKYLSAARQMLQDGTLPEEMRLAMGGQGAIENELNYLGGKTQGRLMNEIRSKLGMEEKSATAAAEGGLLKKVAAKSYDFNGMVDDMYRAMSYLYGHDKALTKGMSEEAARRAGLELSRSILQQWTDITPIERTIMRQVFPFYGFTQHIMRFVMNMPFDHPMRASVMSAFARAELADQSSALPESFLSSLFFGGKTADGRQHAIQLSGMNPFRDTANFFTLAGFMSATNPVLSTIGEAIGIKGGQADLYPNLHYDPQTGKMALTAPNPLLAMLYNTIPQSEILGSMVGMSTAFKQQLKTDPALAMRSLANAGGLPIIVRQLNPTQAKFNTELKLEQAQTAALSDAKKTGDFSYAARFPGLSQAIEQYRQMQQSQPDQFAKISLGQQVPAPQIGNGRMPLPGASVAAAAVSGGGI